MRLFGGATIGTESSTQLDQVLTYLSATLDQLVIELTQLRVESEHKVLIYGPFLARGLLEVGLTTLIARLDPFRLLTIQRVQLSPNYESTVPWRCAIRWQGDVMATKVKDLWSAAVDPKDVSRALTSDYSDELIWRPALQKLADTAPLSVSSRWLSELLATPVASFCARKREALSGLYSQLSKSVHFESVTPAAAMADRVTAEELIGRSAREVAELALLSHFIPHAYGSLNYNEALSEFYALEQSEIVE